MVGTEKFDYPVVLFYLLLFRIGYTLRAFPHYRFNGHRRIARFYYNIFYFSDNGHGAAVSMCIVFLFLFYRYMSMHYLLFNILEHSATMVLWARGKLKCLYWQTCSSISLPTNIPKFPLTIPQK